MSEQRYYALVDELERQVGNSFFVETLGRLFVVGSSKDFDLFQRRFAAALTESGFQIASIGGVDELPGDVAAEDILALLGSGSLPAALSGLLQLRSPMRSILILDDPLLLTIDLPSLFRAGVLDVIGHDASVDELIGLLQRIGQVIPELPAGIIRRMWRCGEILRQSHCVDQLAEPARTRVRARIESLSSLLEAASHFYLGEDPGVEHV